MDMLLKHSQAPAHSGGDYNVEGLSVPVPASANMSEHEVELVLRQLKEYAGLYEDMVHNYERVNKRLLEEDMRRSGNFSLRKPHVTRTVPVKPPAATIREIINTPYAPVLAEGAADGDMTPHPPSSPREPLVVHIPHTPSAQFRAADAEHNDDTTASAAEDRASPETTTEAPALVSQTGPLPHKHVYDSPHRVLTEPTHAHKRSHVARQHQDIDQSPSTLAARMGPLTKRDLLKLVETSDLSANVEIVRIKNELARLRAALARKDSASPTYVMYYRLHVYSVDLPVFAVSAAALVVQIKTVRPAPSNSVPVVVRKPGQFWVQHGQDSSCGTHGKSAPYEDPAIKIGAIRGAR
jgi:hypothetical protein